MILEKRIPISYWFHLLGWDIIIVTLFSTAVFILSNYFIDLELPVSIGTFMGTAIALILSFKLGHSYDRWWEARKIWGEIVNDSRSLVNQLKHFTNDRPEMVKTIAYRQIAWCYSLGQSLREQDSLEGIEHLVSTDEYERLKPHFNVPLKLMEQHQKDLNTLHAETQINDFQQVQIDSTLVRLVASMGKAERIKNTDFPKTYRVTLHLFIYIFLIALSFSLSEIHSLSFFEIPIMVIISVPFFLLEKVAFTIQDPFENRPTDTPVTRISKTIEINLRQLIDEEELPDFEKSEKFYSL